MSRHTGRQPAASPGQPRVLAEAFRVLQPGGRPGVSDVIADDGTARAAATRPCRFC